MFIVFLLLSSRAQDKAVQFTHYVLPQFTSGEVLLKDGQKNSALLNYNALSEEMVFERNGEKMAIADNQLEQVDSVFLGKRKFVRRQDRFLEFISSQPALFVEYKCRIKYPGRVSGPGGQTSQTSSTETYLPTDFRRIIYEVVLPTGYDTSPYRYYWLEKGAELLKIKSVKQLLKFYPDKKAAYKQYKSRHDPDFDKTEDMVALLRFLETN